MPKILIIVTSTEKIEANGRKIGWYLVCRPVPSLPPLTSPSP